MKITPHYLIATATLIVANSSVHAQTPALVAGWDFDDVPNLVGTNVNGYVSEKPSFNNGIQTTGSISTTLTQGTQTFFAANGSAALAPQSLDGHNVRADVFFGESGGSQQSLNFTAGSAFDVVFNFTDAYDVVINADWLTSTTGGTADILDISYSSDGGNSWTSYDKADGGYVALANTSAWTHSTGNAGGFIGFVSNQSDMVIDLTSVTPDEFSTVNAVRFEFVNLDANERLGLDNVHIAGTAVPEPSAFAAIAGVLALGAASVRRRRK